MNDHNDFLVRIVAENTTPTGVLELESAALEIADYLYKEGATNELGAFVMLAQTNRRTIIDNLGNRKTYDLLSMAREKFNELLKEKS